MGLTPGKRNSGKRCKAPVVATRGTNQTQTHRQPSPNKKPKHKPPTERDTPGGSTGQSHAERQRLSALPAKTKNELGPIDGALAKRDRQGKGDAATEAIAYSTPWHVRWIA